jgi:uncharacterized protein YdcH (DUF465 family)
MATPAREIREILMINNPEFQRLAQQHSQFEARLEELTKQTYMNAEDLLLEVELKKRKLRLKDEMERLIMLHDRESAR